jgi:hypothetical protein
MYIWDPEFFLPIPDPGVKKAPDPDLQHCTRYREFRKFCFILNGDFPCLLAAGGRERDSPAEAERQPGVHDGAGGSHAAEEGRRHPQHPAAHQHSDSA